ncbi:2-amino-4-ketopentanoate thiolase [Alkalicella caledoniensis]|uniref:2-amino-4-ketopentanoate thiolase n=1 Tax=Alkalicella caledoniensis TaxID=2731377 RepID=A0A7G9W7T2_ALKCA|nr:2-amino-4-oxopentanoate thiolase subunit OrtA [Alkalicella caledoniensis]QNO14744.1 2-amino-4-ketopentanoate thiolase [Alkalicella caledoniensis]
MVTVPKGSYVEITKEVLSQNQRAPQIPEDTKKTPLMMKVKGFLLEDGEIGETVKIKTVLGREQEGSLTSDNPRYSHDFGDIVPEIFKVRDSIKNFMKTGDCDGQ